MLTFLLTHNTTANTEADANADADGDAEAEANRAPHACPKNRARMKLEALRSFPASFDSFNVQQREFMRWDVE